MSDNNNQPARDFNEQIGEHVRIFRRGRKYYANYQLDGRQHRVSLKTTNIDEARKRARKIDVQLDEGTHQRKVEPKSLAEAVQLYLQHLEVSGRSKKTCGKYTLVMERVLALATKLHRSKPSHINLLFVDQYKVARSKDKKPPAQQTVHDEVTIIRSFVYFCLKRKLLHEDPLAGLSNPDPKPTEQPWWIWNDVELIVRSSPECVYLPFAILAYTGMRFGELQWLTWEDVDFEHNVIHIRPKEGWTPKSKDKRVVPISPSLLPILEKQSWKGKWVTTMPLTKQQLTEGKQWSEKRLLERLKSVLKKLGLPGHLHTFRHSFISYCVWRGISENLIRSWVGHIDPEILRHYAHIHCTQSQEAMKRIMKPYLDGQQGGEERRSA